MRNRRKSGEHSAKDLEICLRHMVGKLLSFSQYQADIKKRKKEKSTGMVYQGLTDLWLALNQCNFTGRFSFGCIQDGE